MTAPIPNPDRLPPAWGGALNEDDYTALAKSWITPELADLAMLRRVNEQEGRDIVGQKGKRDCAGILLPYYWPGDPHPVNYRIRRDHPDLVQATDGSVKEDRKYLGAPGAANRLYIPPGVTLVQLADVQIPVVIVEGEKKALALWRLANHETDQPRFIPIAIPGVWNWRGTVGKTGGPNGERLDIKGPISDLGRINWGGRTVYIIFDTNVHTNESVRAARNCLARHLTACAAQVKLVNLPEDCGMNGIDDILAAWGPEKALEHIEGATDSKSLQVMATPQFNSLVTGIYRITRRGEQLQQTQLTTYQASIKANVLLDDGLESTREFEMEGRLHGRIFRFTIPVSKFAGMDWPIEQMGHAAVTYPNQREYARTAIQTLSLDAEERRVYAHTGWREVNGEWVFIHAGGAIGGSGPVPGIAVRLPAAVSRYNLPLPTTAELPPALRASLRLAALAAPTISFPLLAATCRAVFGDADFAVHLAGETGAFKTEFASLHQQHFGAGMHRKNLPASWSSTGNALEVVAFHAKDTLLVIDDFAPQGNASEVSRYHAAAERVFRAAGNHAGRGRLDSTAKLREAKPPRGLILSTGEDIPRGHSVRARLLLLEIAKGSITANDLAVCQKHGESGLYARAMAAFIQWIARDYAGVKASFLRRVTDLRVEASRKSAHARTPDIVANLQAAFEFYVDFMVVAGVVGEGEKTRFTDQCWSALQEAAAAQGKHQASTEPSVRFLNLLRSCLSSGNAHLQSRTGTIPDEAPDACGWRTSGPTGIPQGDCIGWVVGDAIYLEPSSTYRVIQRAGREVGDQLGITEQTLRKRLHEKGLLATTDEIRQTLTVRRTLCGTAKSVLHFLRATILPEASGEDAEDLV